MENSKGKQVFKLTSHNDASIIFEKKTFYAHSHIADTKDIILPRNGMSTLITVLPFLMEKLKKIEDENAARANDQALAVINETVSTYPPAPPDGDIQRVLINKSTIFETMLTLSTWNSQPYLWLKCYFEAEDRNEPGVIKRFACNGGTLFNDVDVQELTKFVKSCQS